MAAGVHMILFTTGRGTPLGTAVPTIKIATNESLATKKSNWIDFDASPCLKGEDLSDELISYAIEVANGKQSKNEENGHEEDIERIRPMEGQE
jgi:altronate hydrolase